MPIILTKNLDGEVTPDFAAEVKRRAAAGCEKGIYDFLYVVPTRRRVRELQRELVKDVVFGKMPIYTLELFAREVYAKLNVGRRIISPSMQGMIVSEILSKDDFKFFRYLSFRPGGRKGVAPAGTIKKIVDQIDYLRENGIAAEDYRKMLVAAEESERNKLSEFLRIYQEYEKGLDNKLIDSAGLLSLVNREIAGSTDFMYKNSYASLTFFVEGFYNFKKPELEFFRILSSRKNFSFLMKLDCVDANESLFKIMLGTASDLLARGFKRAVSSTENVLDGEEEQESRSEGPEGSFREYFASNLFAEGSSAAKLDMHNKIFVAGTRDRLRQIEFVAEKIREIIKNNPAQKLDRICVASYLPQDYSQIVREVFAKYRIPSNVTDRMTLESNSVVNAVLSFIDVRLADYERSALLRAITNRFIVVSDDLPPSAAGSIIYDAAALCKFERGLRSFKESIAFHLELNSRLGSQDLDDEEIQIRRNARTLKQAQDILESIEKRLAPFTAEMTPPEFRAAIKSLLSSLKIHESVARLDVRNVAAELVERDARALSAFLDVIDEIVDVEMEKVNQRLKLDIWIEKLRSALSLTRYNVRQKYGYGVYVTSLEEIRGLRFDYMFMVGLNEGELPARYSPEIFLPMVSQKENREMQPYLQRHLFYQAVSSFKKALYLIHALRTDDVRLIRSSFIDAVLDIAVCTNVDDSESGKDNGNIYNVQQAIEASDEILETIKLRNANLLPENLERCKNAEIARYKDNKESEFHGRITGNDSIELLSGIFADRVFSSAQLESLARCGFQYFAHRILEIAEVPDIEISLSAIERGAVLHRILFRFYSELRKLDKLDNARDELRLLLEIGKQVLDELGIKHDLFDVERETILGTTSVKGTLELFLEKVQSKLSEYGFQPEIFELAFGMSERISSGNKSEGGIPPAKIGNILLRGKIDRVDNGANGFTIFDYKTSSVIPSHRDVVGDKISPQLILYLSALNQWKHEEKPSGKVAGAAFISINRDKLMSGDDGEDLIRFIVQTDEAGLKYNPSFGSGRKLKAADRYPWSMDELLKETELFFGEKVSEAATGRFNLTKFSYERVCKYCSYSEACRVALSRERFSTEESL
jgi:ATP-dependent helicase/nuclease subunit B